MPIHCLVSLLSMVPSLPFPLLLVRLIVALVVEEIDLVVFRRPKLSGSVAREATAAMWLAGLLYLDSIRRHNFDP